MVNSLISTGPVSDRMRFRFGAYESGGGNVRLIPSDDIDVYVRVNYPAT